MREDQRPGVVYWVDHHVVGTGDLGRWIDWATGVLGAEIRGASGPFTPDMRLCFAYLRDPCHLVGFTDVEPLPPPAPLGEELPRYSLFIQPQDMDEHRRRLERLGVPHTDPIRTTEEGEDATVIYFADPDGNQWEFWAPTRLPEGAMDGCGPLGVGRISGGVYGARDLDRTADFFAHSCSISPRKSADIPDDVLVLPLAGGGRIVYRRVDAIDARCRRRRPWVPLHSGLTVRAEDFFPTYRRMWDALPELEGTPPPLSREDETLRPHTLLHPSPAGKRWKDLTGRGDAFLDWDGHAFHFVGGVPIAGSMALYRGRYMDDYLAEYEKSPAVVI